MKQRFEALDAFRGLAALSIVVCHMHFVGSLTELEFFRRSPIFVEFFFVLSGFVLTHGYGFNENLKFSVFMKARFFRLYPLHLFMFIIFIFLELGKLAAYKYGGFTFNNIPFTGVTALSEVIPNLLLIQSWLPFANYASFNSPAWSISVEFYLYVLLFLSVVTFSKFKIYIWVFIPIIAFYLLSTEFSLLTNGALKGLLCFFGGSLTYLLYKKTATFVPTRILGSLMELAVVTSTIIIVQSDCKYHLYVATLLFCLVIFVFSFESGIVSSCLKRRPFQVAGKLSYSIYMIHFAILFCLSSAMIIFQKFIGVELTLMFNGVRYLTSGNEIINNFIALFVLAIVILISHFTYKYIELKWQKIGRQTSNPSNESLDFKDITRQ